MGRAPYPREARVISPVNKVVSFCPSRCNKARNNDLLAHIANVPAGRGGGLTPYRQVETAACTWPEALHPCLGPVARTFS